MSLETTITKYLQDSKVFEQKIIDCFRNCQPSSDTDNYKKGFDFVISMKFDVKRAKKINRSDEKVNYDLSWLEYYDVNGNYGQLFKEEVDYFFYEREDCFDVRSRLDALELFKKNCYIINENNEKQKKHILTKTPITNTELYQPYQRNGRKDLIMLVEFNNELWKPHFVIPKKDLGM